jgi:hypothetical protein
VGEEPSGLVNLAMQDWIWVIDDFEEVAAFEGDFFHHRKGIECESYNTHSRKCTGSNDTPNRVDIVSKNESVYFLWKCIIVFSFWYCRSMSNFAIFDDEESDIFGNRIDKKIHTYEYNEMEKKGDIFSLFLSFLLYAGSQYTRMGESRFLYFS